MIPVVAVNSAQGNKAIMLCDFKFMPTDSRQFESIGCHSYLIKVTRQKYFNGVSLPNLTDCWLNLKCNVRIDHKVGGAVQTREVWPD